MIYHVNFHNVLPHEKKFFYTLEDIYPYLSKIIRRQIAHTESYIGKLSKAEIPNTFKIRHLKEDLALLKTNDLEKSITIMQIDDEIVTNYKEIFGETECPKKSET